MAILKRFFQETRASVAIIGGLAIVPLVMMVGVAVDYTRAAQGRGELQAALDSTALLLARTAASKSGADLVAQGKSALAAQLAGKDIAIPTDIAVTSGDKIVKITAKSAIKTSFSAIFGSDTLEIAAAAEAKFGNPVELALVLDNTGSMAWSVGGKPKIDSLREASLNLLKTLQSAAFEKDQVRVSIVPFDTQVNVGAANNAAPWIDYITNPPSWVQKATKANWTGCLIDREQPYDANDDAAVPGAKSTLHAAVKCATSNLAPITPLKDTFVTSDYTALKNAVNAMKPSGCTNITIGVRWGLETLSASSPYAEGSTATNVHKFMVVLTDGDNTQNRFVNTSGCGGSGGAGAIDSRTTSMCTIAKSRGITLYTIGFSGGNEAMLKSCATGAEYYSNVSDSKSLDATFQKIAADILRIRITS